MKRFLYILLIALMVFVLCACNNGKQATKSDKLTQEEINDISNEQEKKSFDENTPNGYFRILHTKKLDAFGDESEGPEYIVAIAEATNPYSDDVYEVMLYFNYTGGSSKHSDQNFYFYTPYKGVVLDVFQVDYKIGDEKDYFNLHLHNYAYEDVDPDIYEFLKQCFISGEDITFSVCHGQFVFTIHGEGFAEILGEK